MAKRGLHTVAILVSWNGSTGAGDEGMPYLQEGVAHTGVAFG